MDVKGIFNMNYIKLILTIILTVFPVSSLISEEVASKVSGDFKETVISGLDNIYNKGYHHVGDAPWHDNFDDKYFYGAVYSDDEKAFKIYFVSNYVKSGASARDVAPIINIIILGLSSNFTEEDASLLLESTPGVELERVKKVTDETIKEIKMHDLILLKNRVFEK